MNERSLTISLGELCRVYNSLIWSNKLNKTDAIIYTSALYDFLEHLLSYSGKVTEPVFEDDLEANRHDETDAAAIPSETKEDKSKKRPAQK